MNKNVYFLMAVFFMVLFSSCTTDKIEDELPNSEVLNASFIKSFDDLYNPDDILTNKDGIKFVVIEIARKSKKCKSGFGICRFCFFCTPNPPPSDEVIAEKVNEAIINAQQQRGNPDQEYVLLRLDRPLDPNSGDTDLYIDEDVYAEDGDGDYLPKGIYELNTRLGEYGGYLIPILN